jgi:hypothetical protein
VSGAGIAASGQPNQIWSWRKDGTRTVNIRTAKTHLSRLVAEAAAGEEIIIAKS